jgi:hypothetical protein
MLTRVAVLPDNKFKSKKIWLLKNGLLTFSKMKEVQYQ